MKYTKIILLFLFLIVCLFIPTNFNEHMTNDCKNENVDSLLSYIHKKCNAYKGPILTLKNKLTGEYLTNNIDSNGQPSAMLFDPSNYGIYQLRPPDESNHNKFYMVNKKTKKETYVVIDDGSDANGLALSEIYDYPNQNPNYLLSLVKQTDGSHFLVSDNFGTASTPQQGRFMNFVKNDPNFTPIPFEINLV